MIHHTPTSFTIVDRVEKSIQAIQEQMHLNAVVHTRFDKARKEALLDYSDKPFKGIPILIKCLGQSLKDEPDTLASYLFKDNIATETSQFIQKVQDLGFIILGQTNAPEFGFKNISDSRLYGNVALYNHDAFSAGGSSGGAALALKAFLVPIVTASDGGGSIRIPASYNGLVGLKPSRGSMPTGPQSFRGWQGAAINFFLTHTISDTEILFHAMKTEHDGGPFKYKENPQIKKQYRIAFTTQSPVGSPVSDDAIQAVHKTVSLLKSLGHLVEEAYPNVDGHKIMESYYCVNGAETAAMLGDIKKTDIELSSWVMLQYGKSLTASDLVNALNIWDQTAATFELFHHQYDFILTPTTAKSAPRIDTQYQSPDLIKRMHDIENQADKYQVLWEMFEKSLAITPFTMIANITGNPAISLPLYQNQQGFFLGSQFLARFGNEAALFDLSHQLAPYFVQ